MAGEQHLDSTGNNSPDANPKRKKRLGEGIGEGILRVRPMEGTPKPPRALDLTFDRVVAEVGKDTKQPRPERKAEAASQLTEQEAAVVTEQLVAARTEAVEAERAQADPGEHAALDADGEYLDAVSQRMQAGETPQEAMDAAYDDTIEDHSEVIEGEFGALEDEGEVPLHAYETPPLAPALPLEFDNDSADAASSQQGTSIFGGRQSYRAAAPRAEAPSPAAETSSESGTDVAVAGVIAALVAGLMQGRKSKKTTERQAQAMQRSFERQIRGFHDQLTQHETQIRRLVQERETPSQPTTQPAYEARPATTTTTSQEQKTASPAAPRVEALGPTTNVEQLSDSDLLDISQKIEVGSTNIRRIYEGDRISKRGLKRLVAEYLHGGNVRRVLKQELLIKAIGPELDPLLRDQPSEAAATGAQAPAAPTNDATSSTASQPAQTTQPTTHGAQLSPHEQHVTPGLVLANVIALIILGILFLVLFVTWALH